MTEHADATWEANRQRINGLWPRYQPTEEERRLAVGRLSGLNQRWLSAAIDDYRTECTSTVFRLSELLAVYRRIANTGATRETSTAKKSPDAERAELVGSCAVAVALHDREVVWPADVGILRMVDAWAMCPGVGAPYIVGRAEG